MYRGPSNSDYRRTPLPQPPYGGGRPHFSDPFNRPPYPPPFPGAHGPVSYTSPVTEHPPAHHPPYGGPAADYCPTRDPYYEGAPPKQFQHSQPPQGWTVQQTDLQNLEVRKKAEEFLRILEAKDRLEQSGQSGEKGARRQSQDDETGSHSSEKHSSTRSKSRARSRARSKSRHRSRSRSRSRSRGRSRAKSRVRSRSRSCSRGKSRTRAKSRARSRSRSRSHSKSVTRSKSQPRLDFRKDSQWSTKEPSVIRASPPENTVPDLFQGLKQVLQSKDLEKHLSVVKSAFLRNQSPDEVRVMQESHFAMESAKKLPEFPHIFEPEALAGFNQSGLLPHERAGGGDGSFPRILSWDDPSQQPEAKPVFTSIEDEEEFLYGEEEERTKPQAVTVPLAQNRPLQSPVETISSAESPYLSKTLFSPMSNLQEPKAQTMPSKQPSPTDTVKVTPEDCEKVKNLLKTIGLNLSMADISKMAMKLKQKQAERGGASPATGLSYLKPALDALRALSKAPKSDDSRSNRSGSSHSHRDSEYKEKQSDEKERREKQIQMKRKEYLVKELEGLLKHEGSGDLIPVIGFFCQRCEEFFGDLNSAESHSASHSASHKQNNAQKQKAVPDQPDRHKDTKRHGDHQQKTHPSDHRERERPPVQDKRPAASRIYQDFRERSPERKRVKEERSPHSSSSHGTDHNKNKAVSEKKEDKEEKKDKAEDMESTKSEKKKKKKEKKMKKKEKKEKKKKKKEKAEKQAAE